jgi:hypothetical protein
VLNSGGGPQARPATTCELRQRIVAVAGNQRGLGVVRNAGAGLAQILIALVEQIAPDGRDTIGTLAAAHQPGRLPQGRTDRLSAP